MKKSLLNLSITTAILLTSASLAAQAQALEVRVSPNGSISIYQDQVLGKTTLAQQGQTRGNAAQVNENAQSEQNRPASNQIPPRANQTIEFRRNADAVQIEVVQDLPTSVRMPNGQEAQRAQDLQRFESTRLNTSLPAARKAGVSVEGTELDSGETVTSQYIRNVREERAARNQETIELRTANQENMPESAQKIREMRIRDGVEIPEEADFELESRQNVARIRNSAVSFNPETNSVNVITPSGQIKELNHLPDQAIERFKEQTLVLDEDSLEVIPSEDETIFYRAISEKPVRILGLIPRQIQTELLLNDETGEMVERPVGRETLFSQLLNAISF